MSGIKKVKLDATVKGKRMDTIIPFIWKQPLVTVYVPDIRRNIEVPARMADYMALQVGDEIRLSFWQTERGTLKVVVK